MRIIVYYIYTNIYLHTCVYIYMQNYMFRTSVYLTRIGMLLSLPIIDSCTFNLQTSLWTCSRDGDPKILIHHHLSIISPYYVYIYINIIIIIVYCIIIIYIYIPHLWCLTIPQNHGGTVQPGYLRRRTRYRWSWAGSDGSENWRKQTPIKQSSDALSFDFPMFLRNCRFVSLTNFQT